jgi:hypothetical protein
LWDLLVDNDVDVDTTFGGSSEHIVKTVFLITSRWATQVELGA